MHSTSLRHPLLITLAAEIDSTQAGPMSAYAPTAELWQAAGVFVTDDALALSHSPVVFAGSLRNATATAQADLLPIGDAVRVRTAETGEKSII